LGEQSSPFFMLVDSTIHKANALVIDANANARSL